MVGNIACFDMAGVLATANTPVELFEQVTARDAS